MSGEYICEPLGGFEITSGFVATSPQSAAFLARATNVTLFADKQAYDALITGLVNDGVWSLLDALYIFAAPDVGTAKLNLISTSFGIQSHGTNVDTSGFSAYHGFIGNSSDIYLDTQYTPSTAGGQMSNQNGLWGIYDIISGAPTSFNELGGMQNGVSQFIDLFFETSVGIATRIFSNNGSIQQTASTSTTAGFFAATASGGSSPGTTTLYVNGTAGGSSSNAMVNLSQLTSSLTILGRNDNGTVTNFYGDTISAAVIGAAPDPTHVGYLSTRINNFMRVYGINQY